MQKATSDKKAATNCRQTSYTGSGPTRNLRKSRELVTIEQKFTTLAGFSQGVLKIQENGENEKNKVNKISQTANCNG